MSTDLPPPRVWLNNARAAFREGKYPEALALYDYFFEHALDDDEASFYGVRLSYCLDEWAKLGQVYPPALAQLEKKKNDSLILLEQSHNPERFHDFVAICEYLKCSNESIGVFQGYHLSDRELALSVILYIWDELVAAKQWDLCASYLGDWTKKYARALEKFDMSMGELKLDKAFGGEDFDKRVGSWYVREVSNITRVLRNTDRDGEASSLRQRIVADMELRGQIELISEIDKCTQE
jgi:hypothetical protein